MRKIDWNTYKFRASQCHKLLTGIIIKEENYEQELDEIRSNMDDLLYQKDHGVNPVSGRKVKWTDAKEDSLTKLQKKLETPYWDSLPATFKNELRAIHRAEMFNRNFKFTNKFVQKGIDKEEEAITVYQRYLKEIKGNNTFFINNKQRLENDYVSGEADLTDTNDFSNCNKGYDIKCSWELATFPFAGDDLDTKYEAQNQVYMWLSGAKQWTTAYVLVNATEQLIHNEEMKWFYALGSPVDGTKNGIAYEERCREIHKQLIFNLKEYHDKYGYRENMLSLDEWAEEGNDIPLENRVIEKVSTFDNDFINDLKERITVARKYLIYLDSLM